MRNHRAKQIRYIAEGLTVGADSKQTRRLYRRMKKAYIGNKKALSNMARL